MLPGTVLTGVLVWRAFANDLRAIAERRLLDSAGVDAAALDREFASTINVFGRSPRPPPSIATIWRHSTQKRGGFS